MDIALLCALGAVFSSSLDAICYKWMMKRGACPVSTLFLCSIIASFTMLFFVDWDIIFSVDWQVLALMAVSCVIWGISDWSDVEAYKHMNAATSEMFGALTLIVVLVASVVLFQETINPLNWLGITLILGSLFYRTRLLSFQWNIGVFLRLLGVVFGSAALIYDKLITKSVAEEVMVFYGFAFMSLFYLVVAGKRLTNIPFTIRRSGVVILLSPLLSLATYLCLIIALSRGELSVTYTIQQSCIVLVFLFEVVLLKVRDNILRRGFASACCMLGALLVCVV